MVLTRGWAIPGRLPARRVTTNSASVCFPPFVNVCGVARLGDHTTVIAFVTYFAHGSREFLFYLAQAAVGQATGLTLSTLAGAKSRVDFAGCQA
ncbi:MAG TPA: hypothetical protein VFD30_12225, partial [Terriglobia bacterium]|nr:hypothetical protein [Terriglobia bacterium]